ncbi:MAG: LytR family transcriptional regulator [Clostridiales bacterium]|nr:LytR family transcriptional regulator [Clostridiales bacterium]
MAVKKRRRKKGINYTVLVVLTIIFSTLVGAVAWGVDFYREIKNPTWQVSTPSPTITPSNTPNGTPSGSVTPSATPDGPQPTQDPNMDELVFGKDVLNILVMGYDGCDYRENQGLTVFRTDVMMLCTIYFNEGRVVVTSVPRDSYVPIAPNFTKKDKINSAYAHAMAGGRDPNAAACATVSRLFGNVPVDYFVSIDIDVFIKVIDALGGIECDVEVDVVHDGITEVHKGKQLLDGWKAYRYVTYRSTANGDIDRVARQQRFLLTAFSQLKSLNKLVKLPEVYSIVMDMMSTNLSYAQILSLVDFAMNKLNTSQIETITFPGSFLTKDGVSYWGINQRERVLLIHRLFHITIKPDEQD